MIDDLHGIYLGVTLSLQHLWFHKVNRGKPFFIGDGVAINVSIFPLYIVILQIHQCDERLLSIKVTDEMSRTPKSLTTQWKGNCAHAEL